MQIRRLKHHISSEKENYGIQPIIASGATLVYVCHIFLDFSGGKMSKNASRLSVATVLTAVTLTAAACGSSSSSSASNSSGTTSASSGSTAPVTINVGLSSPNYTPFAALYLAKDKGFFSKLGVNVNFTVYNGGGPMQQAIAAGKADTIQFLPGGMAQAVEKGIKETIVAADQIHPDGWYIVDKAGSPITSFSQMNGKSIAISGSGTATDMIAEWAANKYHVSVQTVPLGATGGVPAVVAGHVAAAVAPPPWAFSPSKSGLQILVNLKQDMPKVIMDSVVFSNAFIKAHPQAVKAYLEGFSEGIAYMQAHPNQALTFLKTYAPGTSATLLQEEYNVEIKDMPTNLNFTPAMLNESLTLAKLAGFGTLPPASQLATYQFVPVKTPTS